MSTSGHDRWRAAVLMAGFVYAAVGVAFGFLAGAAASHQLNLFWRWAAWVVCAAVYAAHIAHERFGLRSSSGSTALHVAAAVALGAFGLAVAAGAHALYAPYPSRNLKLFAFALVAWPAITAVPAYVVAFAGSLALTWFHGLVSRPTITRSS